MRKVGRSTFSKFRGEILATLKSMRVLSLTSMKISDTHPSPLNPRELVLTFLLAKSVQAKLGRWLHSFKCNVECFFGNWVWNMQCFPYILAQKCCQVKLCEALIYHRGQFSCKNQRFYIALWTLPTWLHRGMSPMHQWRSIPPGTWAQPYIWVNADTTSLRDPIIFIINILLKVKRAVDSTRLLTLGKMSVSSMYIVWNQSRIDMEYFYNQLFVLISLIHLFHLFLNIWGPNLIQLSYVALLLILSLFYRG